MYTSASQKSKKPPACDACKARRVLCHSQPNDLPCPRCAEKGIICRTTYIPRGRPRKDTQPVESSNSSGSGESTCASPYNSLVTAQPGTDLELSVFWELPFEIVKHLYQCFLDSPQSGLPLFRNCGLKTGLSSAAWQIDLLMPQTRVLAYCVCAFAATFSFHPAIIGVGPDSEPLTDYPQFFYGVDLRKYGVQRAPMCRVLLERALSMASEFRVQLEVSECNAASCFILDSLDNSEAAAFRPWAVTYINHVRSLAGYWNPEEVEENRAFWAGVLMGEALAATVQRKPSLVSHIDQLLITGSEPPTIEDIYGMLQGMGQPSKKSIQHLVFSALRPFFFHTTRLARELHEKITGDYARRHPIAEPAVIAFLSSLSILQSIIALFLAEVDLHADSHPSDVAFLTEDHRNRDELRKSIFAMTMGFTSLALALHNEMQYRATVSPTSAQGSTGQDKDWARDRALLLRQQAHKMASSAAQDMERALRCLPTKPHIMMMLIHWSDIPGWAQFCLDEADAAGGVPPARVGVFEKIFNTLKMLGYSWDSLQYRELVERMDAHMEAHKAAALFPAATAIFQAGAASDLSDIAFPLDNNWIGMFDMNIDGGQLS
ncbi:hypothetical protein C8R43DRAFT_977899 [Mycena crocata]|nr:hypothetical protein C8R43DRAFT_977899 [Mycena crocata]